ncbi:glycosyltransferase [Campylobacter coli]|nr:glycosyltransferase [Campylobacter coli]
MNSKNTPLVSVIVPVYNVEKYLRQCLDSIVNQTLQEIEIILIDDGSTDGSGSICDEYAAMDSRIVLIHKENAGLGAAYNTGLEIAKGEYIGFVESDDWVELNMFEELYNKAREFDVDVCRCLAIRQESNKTSLILNKFSSCLDLCDKSINNIHMNFPQFALGQIHHWCGIYKKSLISEKRIRFHETLGAAAQDAGFAFKIFIHMENCYIITKGMYNYRFDRPTSSINQKYKMAEKVFKEFEMIYNYCCKYEVSQNILEIFAKHTYDTLIYNYKKRCTIFQKLSYIYLLSDIFSKLAKKISYNYFNSADRLIFQTIVKRPLCFYIQNIFIQKTQTREVCSIKLFNFISLYFNKKTKGYQSFRILHIPIYRGETKGDIYTRYFFKIPYFKKTIKNGMINKYLFGFLYRETFQAKPLSREDILNVVGYTLSCHHNHSQIFPKYKNIHFGQDMVITATGPTLEYAPVMNNAVYIACNRAIELNEKFNFDYIFMIDYLATNSYIEKISTMSATKFLGRYYYNSICSIPEAIKSQLKANTFHSSIAMASQRVYHDIEVFPLADFGTIVHPALHFSLYTHPKRIFLVGCDTSNNGYFANIPQNKTLDVKRLVSGYKKFKDYIKAFYPDVEIISINPVGLKGLFRDVYTKKYVLDHPEICNQEIEIFEDFIQKDK